jgi:hypothetical protein
MSGTTDDTPRRFTIAVKPDARHLVGPGWHTAVHETEGVTVINTTPMQAQVEAQPAAADALRTRLGDNFRVEEDAPRHLA